MNAARTTDLFSTYATGPITLTNRIVLAPLTRSRAIGNVPNDLMMTYYAQRADAGLLITEGTAPSPNGLGYPRIPGMYSSEQVAGWKKVTDAVHAKGGKIFVQLMHTGRVSHPANMPKGAEVVAPSAVQLSGEMFTDSAGLQPYPTPRAMVQHDIDQAVHEYVHASTMAIKAGFDGVELHGANGYLIDQFLNTASNLRTDGYGGTPENRNRFALEVAKAVVSAIGAERTGIRLSPFGGFSDMASWDGLEAQFVELAAGLGKLKMVYIHIVDHSSMGMPAVPLSVKEGIRDAFGGTIIVSGGLDKAKAEAALEQGLGQLAAFGRSFLANPDLVERLRANAPLNEADEKTFYTPGASGYTDYPVLEKAVA